MLSQFSIFQSHLDLAHNYWKQVLQDKGAVIDATAGNGHDSLFLAKNILQGEDIDLFLWDVQEQALENTKQMLAEHLSEKQLGHIHFCHGCHSNIAKDLTSNSTRLIIYNLGYLPGADKALTTVTESTLKSVKEGLSLLCHGGAMSITCYPGHEAGAIEEESLLEFFRSLSPKEWSVCHHRWMNRRKAPSLIFIQRCV